MCGFSAAIADEGRSRLYVGAPGVWYWQGSAFAQSVANVAARPNLPEGPASHDNFQLGYSTAAGDFTGDGVDDVVVGAPRSNGLIGQVSARHARSDSCTFRANALSTCFVVGQHLR